VSEGTNDGVFKPKFKKAGDDGGGEKSGGEGDRVFQENRAPTSKMRKLESFGLMNKREAWFRRGKNGLLGGGWVLEKAQKLRVGTRIHGVVKKSQGSFQRKGLLRRETQGKLKAPIQKKQSPRVCKKKRAAGRPT